MEPQTQKQQITEILRAADNVVITTSKNPDIDQTAAAIALAHIMNKLGKRADAVVSGQRPGQVEFLGTKLLADSFSGIRDFVISLNTSRTEADKLKYVPEGKQLNIYITPYNGNYNQDDVSFRYGDYHADAVIALGVTSTDQLDQAIASQKELLQKSKLITINVGEARPSAEALNWHEPNASSVCELLMSLTEALQSGIVDNEIATALLTGIMAKTEHFTNSATTPKVMTMAAQLMAAGAKQPEILKHLQAVVPAQPGAKIGEAKKSKSSKPKGEMEPAKEEQLSHHQPLATKSSPPSKPPPPPKPPELKPPEPSKPTPSPPPPPVVPPPPPVAPPPVAPPPPPAPPQPLTPPPAGAPRREMVVQPPTIPEPPTGRSETTVQPPRPTLVSQVKPESRLGDARPAASAPGTPAIPPLSHGDPGEANPPETPGSSPPPPPHVDIEAARKAVEEATKNASAPPLPPNPPQP